MILDDLQPYKGTYNTLEEFCEKFHTVFLVRILPVYEFHQILGSMTLERFVIRLIDIQWLIVLIRPSTGRYWYFCPPREYLDQDLKFLWETKLGIVSNIDKIPVDIHYNFCYD